MLFLGKRASGGGLKLADFIHPMAETVRKIFEVPKEMNQRKLQLGVRTSLHTNNMIFYILTNNTNFTISLYVNKCSSAYESKSTKKKKGGNKIGRKT